MKALRRAAGATQIAPAFFWCVDCSRKGVKTLNLVFSTLTVLGGLMVSSSLSQAKPEYTKKEKKACTYCHVDAQKAPKELNAAGKYYKEHDSLAGFQPK